jgi:hypothetical protein
VPEEPEKSAGIQDRIPGPAVPEPGTGQVAADHDIRSGVVLPDEGGISSGASPLVSALVIAGVDHPENFGGHAAALPGAIAAHFYQDLRTEKNEVRRLRHQLESLQDDHRTCCEDRASLRGQVNATEKSWHENIRNVVGGGLMGAAFSLWDIKPGVAIFFFGIGALMVAVPFLPIARKP